MGVWPCNESQPISEHTARSADQSVQDCKTCFRWYAQIKLASILCIYSLSRPAGALEIDWIDHDTIHTHSFLALFVGQCDQWYLSLQRLVTQAQSTPCLDLSHLLRDDSHKAVLLGK